MKKDEIQIGGKYMAKVTGKVVPIRIDQEHPQGGWRATNLVTRKTIRIKSAQRLRRRVGEPGDDVAEAVQATVNGNLAEGILVPRSSRRTKKKLTAKERKARLRQVQAKQASAPVDADKHEAKTKPQAVPGAAGVATKKRDKMGCLDAAAKVLAETGEPMNTRQMIGAMKARDYWESDAATPHATLFSAIGREIKTKGEASRFVKADRGLFTLNKGA